MPVYTLADFGSTFTKVALVDGDEGRLLATAQHPTTVESDVIEGFRAAEAEALAAAGLRASDRALAASSAAGGLRMVAVGLVDDLTAAAAQRSALGAGAKVAAVYSGVLEEAQVAGIRADAPDVLLFAGGTDGGERQRVLANAERVAAAGIETAVVVACNRDVANDVAALFDGAGHETVVVDNVLPDIQRENSEPARIAIRELFISRVVRAKGLSRTSDFFASVLMPTPAAVLTCAELLADGTTGHPGLVSVVVVDLGGATTDIHSVVPPSPDHERIARAGPSPLPAVRTVEGDLGMRWSAGSVLELDEAWLLQQLQMDPHSLRQEIETRTRQPSFVPTTHEERTIDRAIAASCITVALGRHVGRVSTQYVVGEGAEVVVKGRDLRETSAMVLTGGALVRDPGNAESVATTALTRMEDTQPGPRDPRLLIDADYVVAAAGLLATVDRTSAARLLDAQLLRRITVNQ